MAMERDEKNRLSEQRKRAETRQESQSLAVENVSPEEIPILIHDLQTHQIELEIQNEELRRTLDELAASRDRYSDLYNFLPVGCVTVDLNGLIIEANNTLAEMLDIEQHKLVGQRLTAFIFADDQDNYYLHRQVFHGPQQRATVQARLLRQDADPFWVEMDSVAVGRNDDGKAVVRSVISDISARRQSEEAVRQLAAIIEATDDAVDLETPDGTVIHWNKAAERIYGFSRDEIIGKSITVLGPPDRPNELPRLIAAVNNGESFSDFETLRRRKDGSIVEVSATISPVRDSAGNLTSMAVIARDVTQQNKTKKLYHQAQKNAALGQLTAGIAHDFNNLLAVIMGNAELLGELTVKASSMTSKIVRATIRGAELTQRLLAFSRLQSLNPEAVDLSGVILGMQELLERTLGEAIQVEIVAPDGLWRALADPGQIESAVLNLALNARDAMPNGGVLMIECANLSVRAPQEIDGDEIAAGDYAILSVRDQGSGMSPKVREQAFEPFFTTKGVGKGSGLGLSMVYGFAKQSGGAARIVSEMERGTTVSIFLPRAMSQAVGQAAPSHREVPRGKGETILVLEDDPSVRELTVAMLGRLGYSVEYAENAADAREIVDNVPNIRLVLCDVVLPGGTSGPEFASDLRNYRPDLQVIFMSGYPADALGEDGIANLGGVLLDKPFGKEKLARALSDALME